MIVSMKRTQVQLPEPLYQQVKQLAARLDWSITEVLRRGAEYMVRTHRIPETSTPGEGWKLPTAMPLGAFRAPHDEWRELANEPREGRS